MNQKIIEIAAAALAASVFAYQLLKKKRRRIIIIGSARAHGPIGTATANATIVGRSSSKEMDMWLDRLETAFELGAVAFQTWQKMKKRS